MKEKEQVRVPQRRPLPAGRARRLRRGAGASAAAAGGLGGREGGRCHPAPAGTGAGGGDNPTLRPRRLLVTKRLSVPSLSRSPPPSPPRPQAAGTAPSIQLPANPALDSRPPQHGRRGAGLSRGDTAVPRRHPARAIPPAGAAALRGGGRGEMRALYCAWCAERRANTHRPPGRGWAALPAPGTGGVPGTHVPSAGCPSASRSRGPGAERDGESPRRCGGRRPSSGFTSDSARRPDAPARQRPQRRPREGPGEPRPPPPRPRARARPPGPGSRPAVAPRAVPRPGRAPDTLPCLFRSRRGAVPAHKRVGGAGAAAGSALRCSGLWTLLRPARRGELCSAAAARRSPGSGGAGSAGSAGKGALPRGGAFGVGFGASRPPCFSSFAPFPPSLLISSSLPSPPRPGWERVPLPKPRRVPPVPQARLGRSVLAVPDLCVSSVPAHARSPTPGKKGEALNGSDQILFH